jgi:plasmid stabilization system protein ParE
VAELLILPAAEWELVHAQAWYETKQEGLGERLIGEIERVFDYIRQSPCLYALRHNGLRRAPVHTFPYGVWYLVEGEVVLVVAVFHGNRDPKEIVARL